MFSFIFKEKSRFYCRKKPFKKIVRVKEELDGTDRDDIRKLQDLLVLINEDCENSKEVVDGGNFTRNINQKKKPGVLEAYRCQLCDKCYRREYFFNKHLEYCESVR